MSRAEEVIKSQKVKDAANDYCSAYYDWHNEGERIAVTSTFKQGYFEGYEQAEKDLVLTWEDIEEILIIDAELMEEAYVNKKLVLMQSHYEEILKRFNDFKSKKK